MGAYAALPKISEHDTQRSVVQWCALARTRYPMLAWLYAIPNAGKRSLGAYAHMRAEGLRPGIPDLCVPAPVGAFGAGYIEHKAKDNKPSDAQMSAMRALAHMGNAVTVSYSFEKSRQWLVAYACGADITAISHADIPYADVRAFVAELDAIMRHRMAGKEYGNVGDLALA